jgi:multicomponent Na+:H+ antiporter subunit G
VSWSLVLDGAGGVCLLLGAFMCLAGAVGLVRFPDTLSRLHAATKPQTLGLILVLMGLAFTLRTWAALTTLVFVAATQFFTSPVTAQLVGRSAYRHRNVRKDLLIVDELSEALARDGDDDDNGSGDDPADGPGEQRHR